MTKPAPMRPDELGKKPPLGVEPDFIWREKRARALLEAALRYVPHDRNRAAKWAKEAARVLDEAMPLEPATPTPCFHPNVCDPPYDDFCPQCIDPDTQYDQVFHHNGAWHHRDSECLK